MNEFSELIGQEGLKRYVKRVIQYDKISHAYIIEGPKGSGKKTFAKTFSKTLQCLKKTGEPCNECSSCKMFDSNNHPDIRFIESTKKKTIGIDDIRKQLQKDIEIKPYQFSYKIYMIDNAQTLTIQAQNALLKTLEEPPKHGIIFLLTTNIEQFLPTIRSRCVLLNMKPVSGEDIKKYLIQKLELPDYQAMLYASFSQGVIGRGIELARSDHFINMRKNMISVLQKILEADTLEIMDYAEKFEDFKQDVEGIFQLFLTWFRDLLFVKNFGDEISLINEDQKDILTRQANYFSYRKINKIINAIEKAKIQINYNGNFRLAIEMMLLTMKG